MSLRSCAPAFCFYFGASGFCFSEAEGSPHIRMRIGRGGGCSCGFSLRLRRKEGEDLYFGGMRCLFRRDEGVNSGSPRRNTFSISSSSISSIPHPALCLSSLCRLVGVALSALRSLRKVARNDFQKGAGAFQRCASAAVVCPPPPPRPERGACLCERGSRIWRSLNVAEGMGVYSNK